MFSDMALFLLYFLAALFFIDQAPFIRNAGLGRKTISGLFILQVLAGIFTGWLAFYYIPGQTDYWGLHKRSLIESEILKTDPGSFFRELVAPRYGEGYSGIFESKGSFFNDLSSNLVVKVLAILNIISRGNYFINNLLLHIPLFFAHTALFRMFSSHYGQKNLLMITGCFLIPTTLFFTGGTNKDIVVFSSLCFLFYTFYMSVQKKITLRRITILLISLLVLFAVRNYMLLIIAPVFFIYLINKRNRLRGSFSLLLIIAAALVLVVVTQLISPQKGPLDYVAQKRSDFLSARKARTELPEFKLDPTFASFSKNIPPALNHAFLRPYPWETDDIFHLAGAIELYLILILCLVQLIRKKSIRLSPFEAGLIGFSLLGLILIGYIVPNYGSILRYRSVYLPFLITPLLISLEGMKRKRIII